jgi:hypothetical protein
MIKAAGLVLLLASLPGACNPRPSGLKASSVPVSGAPDAPAANGPEAAPATPPPPPGQTAGQPPGQIPGFVDAWATVETGCVVPAETYVLTQEVLTTPPRGEICAITSISEQHPTGRSMIYTVAADCMSDGAPRPEIFKFRFGASDTVMQLEAGALAPVRLLRCPRQ